MDIEKIRGEIDRQFDIQIDRHKKIWRQRDIKTQEKQVNRGRWVDIQKVMETQRDRKTEDGCLADR